MSFHFISQHIISPPPHLSPGRYDTRKPLHLNHLILSTFYRLHILTHQWPPNLQQAPATAAPHCSTSRNTRAHRNSWRGVMSFSARSRICMSLSSLLLTVVLFVSTHVPLRKYAPKRLSYHCGAFISWLLSGAQNSSSCSTF